MKSELRDTVNLYKGLYKKHGHSPEALGWKKGKQFFRFHQLTSEFELEGASILDVGCGFGDFVQYLNLQGIKNYTYVGVDIMPEFIALARTYNNNKNATYVIGDFQDLRLKGKFDYVIASGTFNSRDSDVNCYEYAWNNMSKMFDLCKRAISIGFLSDKVDYAYEFTFNYSPENILGLAYRLSRNIVLKNNYFPFEFSILVNKDESFSPDTTTYKSVEKALVFLKG